MKFLDRGIIATFKGYRKWEKDWYHINIGYKLLPLKFNLRKQFLKSIIKWIRCVAVLQTCKSEQNWCIVHAHRKVWKLSFHLIIFQYFVSLFIYVWFGFYIFFGFDCTAPTGDRNVGLYVQCLPINMSVKNHGKLGRNTNYYWFLYAALSHCIAGFNFFLFPYIFLFISVCILHYY